MWKELCEIIYETYQFRQMGGYNHGTFKEVDDEKMAAIAAHPKVKAVGERRVIGFCSDGVFAKIPAEVSFMDANCTQLWQKRMQRRIWVDL